MELLVQILSGGIDFTRILTFVMIYLGMLWFALCLWVFVDARKRYRNPIAPFLFFLGVFFLNFPILVFYLIIRPENPEENIFYLEGGESSSAQGGVNVPVANFINDNGEIQFSLNLKINKEFNQNGVNLTIDGKGTKLQEAKIIQKPVEVVKVVSAPVIEAEVSKVQEKVVDAKPSKDEVKSEKKNSVVQNVKDEAKASGKRFNNGLRNMAGNIAGRIKLAKKKK